MNSMDEFTRNEINGSETLPEGTTWNAQIGWEQYKNKYPKKNLRRKIQWMSLAASLIFCIIIWAFIGRYSNNNVFVEIRSNSAKKEEVLLKDGSKIWLNCKSSLRVNLKKGKIELEGEAYFELSEKNKYVISSPHGKFEASNCSFNLKTRKKEEGAMLTVSKGNVGIIWEGDITQYETVETGTQAKLIPSVAIVKIPIFDTNYLSWKTEELHFDNTPLYCIIDKLEELNNIEIDVTNKNMRYCRISSDINSTSTKEVLQKVAKYLNYKMEYKDKKYIINGNGCNI